MQLIDFQVNGYMGVDFSSPNLNQEYFVTACKQLIKHGVTAFLPTLITSNEKTYCRNLRLIARASERKDLKKHILGIHAEGPFISKAPGYVGAHNPKWAKEPDIDFLKKMQNWAEGKIKIITIAAELSGSARLCEYASTKDITVFLGHQNAKLHDLEKLANAGAKALTHFGNGIPNTLDRHNNILLYGLACDKLAVTIITDGHHLPWHLIRTIIRIKGIGSTIVISDASPIAGLPPGKYKVSGNNVVLEKNGYLHNPKKKCMVGSSSTMVECVKYLKNNSLLSESQIKKVVFLNQLKMFKKKF